MSLADGSTKRKHAGTADDPLTVDDLASGSPPLKRSRAASSGTVSVQSTSESSTNTLQGSSFLPSSPAGSSSPSGSPESPDSSTLSPAVRLFPSVQNPNVISARTLFPDTSEYDSDPEIIIRDTVPDLNHVASILDPLNRTDYMKLTMDQITTAEANVALSKNVADGFADHDIASDLSTQLSSIVTASKSQREVFTMIWDAYERLNQPGPSSAPIETQREWKQDNHGLVLKQRLAQVQEEIKDAEEIINILLADL